MHRRKVVVIHSGGFDPYAKKEIEILRKYFDVKVLFHYKGKKGVALVLKNVLTTDINVSLFAGDHAAIATLLSKLFHKKSVVVVCGGDVAYMPEINYGDMRFFKSRLCAKIALTFGDAVLSVSKFTAQELLKYATPKFMKVIYHGFDATVFKPGQKKDDKLVVTVGAINKTTILRKGLETFVKSAKYLPDMRFVLIGGYDKESYDYLKSIGSENVEFTGFVPFEQLLRYLQTAKVYAQLSAHEAFCSALAEAMLCECVPVVTRNAALPEVVGETGFYVPYNDLQATVTAIKLAAASEKGKEARARIAKLFPIERREKALISTILGLLHHL